jgi:hypothetical protein
MLTNSSYAKKISPRNLRQEELSLQETSVSDVTQKRHQFPLPPIQLKKSANSGGISENEMMHSTDGS